MRLLVRECHTQRLHTGVGGRLVDIDVASIGETLIWRLIGVYLCFLTERRALLRIVGTLMMHVRVRERCVIEIFVS
jgi:hypothetical protein